MPHQSARLNLHAVRQLIALRSRRSGQARQILTTATTHLRLHTEYVGRLQNMLISHEAAWREVETVVIARTQGSLLPGPVFRNNQARLDRLADWAVQLREQIMEAEKTVETILEIVTAARQDLMLAEQQEKQAQNMCDSIIAKNNAMQALREEQELGDLAMARHTARQRRHRDALEKRAGTGAAP